MEIAAYIRIRKKGEALKELLKPLTPTRIALMDKDNDGVITQQEFLEFNLVKLGYTDVQTVSLIKDVFNHLDYDGSGALTLEDLDGRAVDGRPSTELLLRELRARHGIYAGDENEIPVGIFGMKLSFHRPGKGVPHLWEGTKFPTGQAVIHKEHGRGKVIEILVDGSRKVEYNDPAATLIHSRDDWNENLSLAGQRMHTAQ